MKNLILLLFFLASLSAQNEIEGRWHLVGYEDNVMYQFEDNYRYSIYSMDGTFGEIEDAGGSPNPYTVIEDIITIDLFFGTIVNYQMNYRCSGQVVEFIDNGAIHSILFREGYNFIENECESAIGDFNNDETVDILDVIILTNHILNAEAIELEGSDINNDGDVNILDIIQLVSLILINS